MKRLTLMLTLLCPLAGAAVNIANGTDLQEQCVDTDPDERNADSSKHGSCVSFLNGLATATRHFPKAGECSVGPDVTSEQLRQAWLEFADENADVLHFPAGFLAKEAFASAWFCRRQ